jgi:hypothetical protein
MHHIHTLRGLQMKKTLVTPLIPLFLMANAYAANPEPYGPFNVDGGKETCRSLNGTEIKKFQTFTATKDRYFRNVSVTVLSGVSQKGPATCSVLSSTNKRILLKSADGYEVPVEVLSDFTVYAHSDCGSGAINLGKTISIECTVTAEQWKYSNE